MPVNLDRVDVDLLMGLQYDFPRGPTPYCSLASKLGLEPDEYLHRLRALASAGVVKRVGFYVNYRSRGLTAALIAYSTNGRIGDLVRVYAADEHATHVYQRDHPVYDLWVVTKRRTLDDIVNHAQQLADEYDVDFVVLYSRRTFKLSVKFDLYEGISRAGPYSRVAEKPPRPEDLGVPPRVLRLYRSLPLDRRPYTAAARELGVGDREASALAWRLLEAGILGDPGAALDGRAVGFEENAMVVLEPRGREEELCECVAGLPFTTHVVLRGSIPRGKWRHTCYFMVHAVSRSKIEEAVGDAVDKCNPRSYLVIRSIADLKPGVAR